MHFSGKEKRDGVEKSAGCEILVQKERAGNVGSRPPLPDPQLCRDGGAGGPKGGGALAPQRISQNKYYKLKMTT